MTISNERLDRAAKAVARSLNVNEKCWAGYTAFLSVILEADAPEIAAAELRGRIEGMHEARGIANTVPLNISANEWTVGAAIDSITERIVETERRLASLQPEVAKREDILP